MILFSLLTIFLTCFSAISGENRCRYAQYFYSIIQAEVTCHKQCQDASGKCTEDALLVLCQDTTKTCDLVVQVQSSEHYASGGPKKDWALEKKVNPASYVKGVSYPRDTSGTQYTYFMYDKEDEVADDLCYSFILTVVDQDGSKETVLAENTIHLKVPTKAEFDKNPERQSFCTSPELNTTAKCSGKDGKEYMVKIKIWILFFYRRFNLNDGTKLVYRQNHKWWKENCGDPTSLSCKNSEYFYIKEVTHDYTEEVTGERPKCLCFGGQLEGYDNYPPGWECGESTAPVNTLSSVKQLMFV